jgi:hypothetical protein
MSCPVELEIAGVFSATGFRPAVVEFKSGSQSTGNEC